MILFKYAWVGFIAITCLNAAVWRSRGRSQIAKNPALEGGYRKMTRGLIIYGNAPWLVMGTGIVFGGVPSVLSYFNRRNGPFVLAWWASVVAMWIALGYWLLPKDGAEALARHPGLLNRPFDRPGTIKLGFGLAVLGGIVALLLMLSGNLPVPDLG